MSYLSFPGIHHARIRSTNMLERLFKEVKRRTRVVGVFPNERSASILATEIALGSSEEWALKRYLAMDALSKEQRNQTHNFRDIDSRSSLERVKNQKVRPGSSKLRDASSSRTTGDVFGRGI